MTDLVQFSNSLIKQLVHTKSISVGNPTVIAVCCQLSAVSQGNCILLKKLGLSAGVGNIRLIWEDPEISGFSRETVLLSFTQISQLFKRKIKGPFHFIPIDGRKLQVLHRNESIHFFPSLSSPLLSSPCKQPVRICGSQKWSIDTLFFQYILFDFLGLIFEMHLIQVWNLI